MALSFALCAIYIVSFDCYFVRFLSLLYPVIIVMLVYGPPEIFLQTCISPVFSNIFDHSLKQERKVVYIIS